MPVAHPIEPCAIPAKPRVTLEAKECDGQVCFSSDNAIELAKFLKATAERNIAIARCPYIKEG